MTDLTNETEKPSLGGSEFNDGLGMEIDTVFQARILIALKNLGMTSTSELAYKLKTSRVAIVSSCRSLERKSKVWSSRSDDTEHAVLMWSFRKQSGDA